MTSIDNYPKTTRKECPKCLQPNDPHALHYCELYHNEVVDELRKRERTNDADCQFCHGNGSIHTCPDFWRVCTDCAMEAACNQEACTCAEYNLNVVQKNV